MNKFIKKLVQVNEPKIDISNLNLTELNITILGVRGSGKSTFAKSLISKIDKSNKKTIIILDPMDEYFGKFHFNHVDEFIQRISDYGLEKNIYVFKSNSQSENEDFLDVVEQLENCLIVFEECSKFSKPQGIYESFGNIVNYGRHNKLTYLAIARRSAEIHKDIISNSHFIIAFNQTIPNDIKLLSEYGFSDQLKDLKVFEYELKKIGIFEL